MHFVCGLENCLNRQVANLIETPQKLNRSKIPPSLLQLNAGLWPQGYSYVASLYSYNLQELRILEVRICNYDWRLLNIWAVAGQAQPHHLSLLSLTVDRHGLSPLSLLSESVD